MPIFKFLLFIDSLIWYN